MTPAPSFLIRPFTVDDHAEAIALWSVSEGITLNESDGPEAIARFLAHNPGFSAVAVSAGGEMVGAVLCGHNGRAGLLQHLAVARAQRGQGIGRRLVEFCFAALAQAGIPRCNIFVYKHNDQGNQFWLRQGWQDPSTWKVLQKYVEGGAPDTGEATRDGPAVR